MRRASCARLGRDAVDQAVLRLRRRQVAGGAWRRSAATERKHASAIASGSTWSTTTSSRCRTSGSIPGTPPGTWRFTPWRFASSTWISPRSNSSYAAGVYLPSHRPDPGLRMELQRRQSAGARLGHACSCIAPSRRCTAEGDIEFLKRSFAKLMLNFSWWVNRKDRFGKNVFEGGFLGWTISASSTAARRCPPAGIWSRPTAPPGCACSPEHGGMAIEIGGPRSDLRGHGHLSSSTTCCGSRAA